VVNKRKTIATSFSRQQVQHSSFLCYRSTDRWTNCI